MSRPEEFREDVYPAEGHPAQTGRSELGEQLDTPRGAGSRDTLREIPSREPLFREAGLREVPRREPADREVGPSTNREGRERLSLNRNPEPAPRLAGSPLQGTPLGAGSTAPGGSPHDPHAHRPVPPGRALSTATTGGSQTAMGEDSSAMQRAMGLLKQAAPFVARLLPLLDGNITTAVSNLFAPRPHPPAPPVDLTPVHNQLAEFQLQHNDLRTTVQEQTTTLKRVEDQLEMVREATDRNTLEQQELMEDLKAMGTRVSRIALGVSVLLLVSIGINLWLYLYIRRVLP